MQRQRRRQKVICRTAEPARGQKFLFYTKEELSPLYFTRFIKIKPPNYMTFINFPRGT